ncbi:unnamed protein product (macronuclear) [Paramecium tetraurelia]|uniref:Spindle pole body component n=1 Tax=Paramecium tetraurelia TaxID=5888 RepID=A0CHF4_PARTE|nr:uncharacterized protein GSPATT00038323001 [Paramecium tetraurelia]CAK70221.1 unnamed protein product [Paramecium tetraurelia]|eukprot:XP_001437618.1 hypothetical protein (macronuclear) [Paramecium tetraurelia strain d4-2]
MSEELKDTFDGYLMFDFSNFHGLMAQTFDNEEIDIPRVEKQPKRKAYNIPGPYLDSPPIEFERSGDCSEGILFNGQLGEDDIPEVNLDEDCLSNFNYSTSGFNLLANLDFEPDEDAYDNAINATSEPNSLHHRNSKISRTKKISIFSPTLQFDDNVDQKIQMITLQNMELLKKEDHYDIDDFYKFLTSLDFLNVSNQKHNDDLMKVDQLFHLVQIRQFFDKMVVILFQKTDQSHSISYTSKLDSFKEKMDHFINLVQYMVDDGTYRQKSLRDQHVFKKDYTLTMSVAFFKGLEIISLYKSLLMQKNMQDRLKKYTTAKKNLHSYWRLWGLIKEFEISFVQKNIQKSPNLTNSTLGNQKESVELAILDPHAKIQIARNKDNNNKISLQGFDKYLNKPCLKNTNYCFAGKWNQKKLQTSQYSIYYSNNQSDQLDY